MENQLEYYTETGKYRDRFDQGLPAMAAYTTFRQAVYKDGALSQKMKRLIVFFRPRSSFWPEKKRKL